MRIAERGSAALTFPKSELVSDVFLKASGNNLLEGGSVCMNSFKAGAVEQNRVGDEFGEN